MADYHMVGCCWIEVPANQYNTVRGERESQCQIEVSLLVVENLNDFACLGRDTS